MLNLTTNVISTLQVRHIGESASSGIFHQLLQRVDDLPEKEKTNLLASNMVDQVHAGHEATGITWQQNVGALEKL